MIYISRVWAGNPASPATQDRTQSPKCADSVARRGGLSGGNEQAAEGRPLWVLLVSLSLTISHILWLRVLFFPFQSFTNSLIIAVTKRGRKKMISIHSEAESNHTIALVQMLLQGKIAISLP